MPRTLAPFAATRPAAFLPIVALLLCTSAHAATFTVTNLADSGSGSLRSAIAAANANPGADTVDFAAGLSGMITLTSGPLTVSGPLTLLGPGAATLAVSGGGTSGILRLDGFSGASLDAQGLTLRDGAVPGGAGSAVDTTAAPASFTGCDFVGNADGAIITRAYGGRTLLIQDCRFTNNTTPGDGGAVNSGTGTTTIRTSTFTGNTAGRQGGAAFLGGAYTVEHCAFSTNGSRDGGALFLVSVGSVRGSAFSGNTATGNGGGVWAGVPSPGPTVSACRFDGNEAAGFGGGLFSASDAVATVTGCWAQGNRAATGGGFGTQGVLNVVNGVVVGNVATTTGGGIGAGTLFGTGRLGVFNTTVADNSAPSGGGIYSRTPLTLANAIVWNNGGGSLATVAAPTVTDTDIAGGFAGAGNFASDPLFVGGGDYRLLPGSPCVDTGNNASVPAGTTTDFAGAARIQNGVVDRGAYEGVAVTNHPPVASATAPASVTVPHDGDPATVLASFGLDGSASSDPDGDPLTYAWSENGVPVSANAIAGVSRAAGTHVFTLEVTDPSGLSDTAQVTVVVLPEPNGAPAADAGTDTSATTAGATADVALSGSGSDSDGDPLTYAWYENGVQIAVGPAPTVALPVGVHTLTLRVTDPYGASAEDTVVVTVTAQPLADTTAPTLSAVSATPTVLWPANHKMVTVSVAYTATDDTDPAPKCWLTVASSEPDNGTGDGDTEGDIEIVDAHTVRLRAERSGQGAGRTYTITIHCRDRAGNEATAAVSVWVPKSRGK